MTVRDTVYGSGNCRLSIKHMLDSCKAQSTLISQPSVMKLFKEESNNLMCVDSCCSSEANDLALRLARAHTGNEDAIVLDQFVFSAVI